MRKINQRRGRFHQWFINATVGTQVTLVVCSSLLIVLLVTLICKL